MMALMDHRHHSDATFQISSKSDIRNPVKNTPVHHLGVGSLKDRGVVDDGDDHLDGS